MKLSRIHTLMLAIGALGVPTHGQLGDEYYSMSKPAINSGKKCLLPDCNVLTNHNGGYCCAKHCKLHRAILKEAKE